MFCVKCRKATNTTDLRDAVSKNGRNILTGKRNVTKYRCNLFHSKNEKFKLSYIN